MWLTGEHDRALAAMEARLILGASALDQALHLLIFCLHVTLYLLRKLLEAVNKIIWGVCMVDLRKLRHQCSLLINVRCLLSLIFHFRSQILRLTSYL